MGQRLTFNCATYQILLAHIALAKKNNPTTNVSGTIPNFVLKF